jgi:ABC-type antimicrobial peptide transport system permease subunit
MRRQGGFAETAVSDHVAWVGRFRRNRPDGSASRPYLFKGEYMRDIGMEVCLAARRVFSTRQISAIIVLSIGLILATVMFAVGRGYSVYSIPYDKNLVLIQLQSIVNGKVQAAVLSPQPSVLYFACKKRSDVFADVAAYKNHSGSLAANEPKTVRDARGDKRIKINPVLATRNFFDVLGISFPGLPAWKDSFESPHPLPVVITDSLARKKFGYAAIGQTFTVSDDSNIVVSGALPPAAILPFSESDLAFEPLTQKQPLPQYRTFTEKKYSVQSESDDFTVIARLNPGVTPQVAEQMLASEMSEMSELSRHLAERLASSDRKYRISVPSLAGLMARGSLPNSLGAWTLGGMILVICAANLAGMLLVRCSFQLREYAVRNALGANLADLIRLPLLELALLALVAIAVAWFFGRSIVAGVADFLPVRYLAFGKPDFGMVELLFLVVAAVVLVGVASAPMFAVIVKNYWQGFSSGQMAVFSRSKKMRMALTLSQTALAMLLLILTYTTGHIYLDTFKQEATLNPDTHVVTVSYSPKFGPDKVNELVEQTLAKLNGGNPNARISALSGKLMGVGNNSQSQVPLSENRSVSMYVAGVMPGFFRALDVRLVAGKEYDSDSPLPPNWFDRFENGKTYFHIDDDSQPVDIVINRTMAAIHGWTPQEAIGKKPPVPAGSFGPGATVIGVVEDIQFDVEAVPIAQPMEFVLFASSLRSMDSRGSFPIHYLIATNADSRAGALEKEVMTSDPDAVIVRNATMGSLFQTSMHGFTFAVFSVALFAFCAVGIVAINIVSTIGFIIVRRTRDIAIYIALGVPFHSIRWLVMRDMVLAGAGGVLVSGIVCYWIGRVLDHLSNGTLFPVLHLSLWGLLAPTAAALLAVIALAAWIPATRALRIEPNTALHTE